MVRYFFHVRSGVDLSRDLDGETMPGIVEAMREAVLIARDHICGVMQRGLPLSLDGFVDVCSADGAVQARMSFADAAGQTVA